KRQRILGRHLLLTENEAGTGPTVRLYDVLTGKDVWKETFLPNTLILNSEVRHLFGVIEMRQDADRKPLAQVRLFDLFQHKEVMTGKLDDVTHLEKVQQGHLVADTRAYYVLFQTPPDPAQGNPRVLPNVVATSGMRSLLVNGWIYSFDQQTGKR